MSEILDSGTRREFGTGAVRDVQEGKGRCDLMPLDVLAMYYSEHHALCPHIGMVFESLHRFMTTGDTAHLFAALRWFRVPGHYERSETMFLELAKHYEAGAVKYGERNWEKGIPVHCYIDSAVRHLLKFIRGDDDEPHDRAFVWNVVGAIWTVNHCPDMMDIPIKEDNDNGEK